MSTGEEEEDEELDSDEEEISEAENEEEEDEDEEGEELEPKVLPQRATRGSRMNKLLDDEESGDEEFWNQDFFAEEAKDKEFSASESEKEDVADTDFSESEDEDDEDEDEIEAKARREERKRRKVLKPPGQPSKRLAPIRAPKPGKSSGTGALSPGTQAALRAAQKADAAEVQAPALRKSTKRRREEADKERARAEKERPKKRRVEAPQYRLLSQEELLAEAAQTEIENLRSLEIMQAIEEEVKQKAAVKRARYSGPYICYHSKKVDGEALTTCEVANMLPPPEMEKQRAPPPKKPAVCFVTGKPAKYKDPLTGKPYHDAFAFSILRQSLAATPAPPRSLTGRYFVGL